MENTFKLDDESFKGIKQLQSYEKPCCEYVSEDVVDGIVATASGLWISHSCCISFLHPGTLAVQSPVIHPNFKKVSQLKLSYDQSNVWTGRKDSYRQCKGAIYLKWISGSRCRPLASV